jgi:two-component system response regulator FixJ
MGQFFALDHDLPVFIVDDDPSVRDALSLLLKIEGFSTRGFGDGGTFFEALRDQPVLRHSRTASSGPTC